MKSALFQESLQTIETAEKSARLHSNRIVFYRFSSFCLTIVFAAAGYDYSPLFYGAAVGLGLIFLRLLQLHKKIKSRQLLLQNRREVLLQYLARLNTDWRSFSENGAAYLSEDLPQARDLDIFGPASLYQYICTARTALGRKKLAAALSPTPPPAAMIAQRQAAAAEFIAKPKLSLELQALSRLLPDNHDTSRLIEQLESPRDLSSRLIQRSATILPLLTLGSLLGSAAGKIPWEIAGALMFLQFCLAGFFYSRTAVFLAPLFEFYRALKPYEQLFSLWEEASLQSAYLQELQQKLQAGRGATAAIRQLRRIGEFSNMRRNIFCYAAFNALLLWDFHCILQFSRWKESTAQHMRSWLHAFAEIELLLSLAVIGQVKEEYVFPVILPDHAPSLQAEEIKHILLSESTAVANSLQAAGGTYILTGSNMSGKTTFLRTLAASAILAYAGAPVCARAFALPRMQIFTSMRVQDDISRGLSTFYAELLRIKSMVEYSRQELPMFALIDEIFKGTNSADRIIGAQEAIRKLSQPWSMTFVSTHDFELCDMVHEQKLPITNYHFAEYYEGDAIHFDYKLKPGRCQSTNAKYLLKLAGIL